MIVLFDIGNSNTHVGLATRNRVVRHFDVPTADWFTGRAPARVARQLRSARLAGAGICSVVPTATPLVHAFIEQRLGLRALEVTHKNITGVGINYPQPETIGPDRLANAVAATAAFGAPVVVLDFGTAVTFDVIDRNRCYVGGIIAPGLAAMTEYLHERTALLPRIHIREISTVIGRSTEEAMLVGAVHGYRGLIRGLLLEIRRELRARRLPVVATGGYASLIAARLPEIREVRPALTLDGIRLIWLAHCRESTAATE